MGVKHPKHLDYPARTHITFEKYVTSYELIVPNPSHHHLHGAMCLITTVENHLLLLKAQEQAVIQNVLFWLPGTVPNHNRH